MHKDIEITQKKPNIFLLIILISVGTIAAQFYILSIPNMTHFFDTSLSNISWTMSIFLVGYAVGQLIYGPLGNFFGRKGGFTIGILTTFLASVLCVSSLAYHKFWVMLLGRFLMALGSSSGLSLTMTVIKDSYKGSEARRITSLAISAFSILPGVAIILNGFLSKYFGWQSAFYFMAIYSVFVLFILQYLPETKEHTVPINYIEGYRKALASRSLWLCSLIMGCSTAGIYLFSTYGPSIAITYYGYTEWEFALVNFIPNFSLFIGVMFSAIYADKISGKGMMVIGATLYFLGALTFIILLKLFGEPLWALFTSVSIMFLGIPVVYSNAASLATGGLKDVANASSIMSALNLFIGSVAVFVTSAWEGVLHIALQIEYVLFAIFIIIMLLLTNNFARLDSD